MAVRQKLHSFQSNIIWAMNIKRELRSFTSGFNLKMIEIVYQF